MTSALNYFLKILEKKDYSVKELQLKAKIRDYPEQETSEAIAKLIDYKYIDDIRLAEFLIQKYKPVKGIFWIKRKLQQRQLPRDLIDKLISQEDPQETDLTTLKAKIGRKYKVTDWKNIDPKVKNKILGYLSRNGFSNIYDILGTWINS